MCQFNASEESISQRDEMFVSSDFGSVAAAVCADEGRASRVPAATPAAFRNVRRAGPFSGEFIRRSGRVCVTQYIVMSRAQSDACPRVFIRHASCEKKSTSPGTKAKIFPK